MMLPSPVLLGYLWLVSHFCCGLSQDNNHETHQVYSYTYHFQHNGTTDSKQFVRSLLGAPPNNGEAVVKTFWNPNVRGFVSQGFFPARSNNLGFSSQLKPPTFQGIKKIVDDNLKQVPNPTPPELIKIPPHIENTIQNIDEEVNRRLSNANHRLDNLNPRPLIPHGPRIPLVGRIPNLDINHGPPQPNNEVVRDVKTFEKDLPNGKIFEKIETFSYNPSPINNVGGNQQNPQVFNQNQRAFGRTVSYFRKEHKSGISPLNQLNKNSHVNQEISPIRAEIGNFNQQNQNLNSNFNRNRNAFNMESLLENINDIRKKINSNFGQRINNFQNSNIHQQQPRNNHLNQGNIPFNENHHSRNTLNQNTHHRNNYNINNNNNRNFHNSENQNIDHDRSFPTPENQNFNNRNFHNPANVNGNRFHHNQANQYNNNDNNRHLNNGLQRSNVPVSNVNHFHPDRSNIDNTANKVLNTLNHFARNTLNGDSGYPHDDQKRQTNGNSFTWDDDNKAWREQNDWSGRIRVDLNNNRPFVNEIANNVQPINNHHNPVNILKSTLESLTGRPLIIPNFNGDGGQSGNYNNIRGGGEERTFDVDIVSQGPNSYNRNQQRRYERNFGINSDSGYQFSKRWSTGDLGRLDTVNPKSPTTFKKDFIDVFDDEN